MLICAYIAYVRPLLEYNCVFESDIELIEQVQRLFTKRLHGLPNYAYDERLKMLNLEIYKFIRFDLIMFYKIIFGLVCVNADDFLSFVSSNNIHHLVIQPYIFPEIS